MKKKAQLHVEDGDHPCKTIYTQIKSYGDGSFSFSASTEWKKLPVDIKLSPTLGSFKSNLKVKTHIRFVGYIMFFSFVLCIAFNETRMKTELYIKKSDKYDE